MAAMIRAASHLVKGELFAVIHGLFTTGIRSRRRKEAENARLGEKSASLLRRLRLSLDSPFFGTILALPCLTS